MKRKLFQKEDILLLLGATFCCLLWGSAFPVIKIGYEQWGIASDETGRQLLFAGIRFVISGIMAVVIGSVVNKKILVPTKESFGSIFHLSLLQTVIQYFFFYVGLARTTGTKASIVEALNVFVAIFVSSIVFRQDKIRKDQIYGSVIGFAGVVFLQVWGSEISWTFRISGEGFIFASTVAYAFSSVYLKKYSKRFDPFLLSGYQFILGGLLLVAMALFYPGELAIEELYFNGKSIGVLLYLALVSAVAYSIWGVLLKRFPVARVVTYGFLTPVFGVVLSAFLLGEWRHLNPLVTIVSLLLVGIGTTIAQREA